MISVIEELGNPFEDDSEELIVLDTGEMVDDSVMRDSTERIGPEQFNAYVKKQLVNHTVSVTDMLTKNKLPLFSWQPVETQRKYVYEQLTKML